MPLIRISSKQLEASQRLYLAATKLVEELNRTEYVMQSSRTWKELVEAIDNCKERFETHGI